MTRALVSVLVACTAAVAMAGTASAAQAASAAGESPRPAVNLGKSCGEDLDPYNTTTNTSFPRYRAWNGIDIEMRAGTYTNGRQIAWARVEDGYGNPRVWMDISYNGGADWYQCGPVRRDTTNTGQVWTQATYTSTDPNLKMRACADDPGTYSGDACTTPWW
jgi:hypothetical protein